MSLNKSYLKIIVIGMLCGLFLGCGSQPRSTAGIDTRSASNSELGMRYLLGRGVRQDNQQAFYYFNKAANEEDVFAENELGFMYAAGKGTPRNYQRALYYYEKAANHGLASAQYNLGLLYLHGLGAPKNKAAARAWFQRSEESGFEPARKALKQVN